jgi:hypothetical protein
VDFGRSRATQWSEVDADSGKVGKEKFVKENLKGFLVAPARMTFTSQSEEPLPRIGSTQLLKRVIERIVKKD